ncbi:MAG: hypothetical protein KDD50_01565 [Bdellovibrionales bacterium]|nr:hypothetical protein [Bdellovibrionales bacterium]
MGLEVEKVDFKNEDFLNFFYSLEKESLLLKNWIENKSLSEKGHSLGTELETWIVDQNKQPNDINLKLLSHMNNHQMVPELSKYNVEINGTPHFLSEHVFSEMGAELQNLLHQLHRGAENFNSSILTVGILPTLKKSSLSPSAMTPYKRYMALNDALIRLKQTQSFQVHVSGKDIFRSYEKNIMLASAATSFQFQWKIPFSLSRRVINALQILTPASVALSANSPFVFKNQLWQESRIPIFEHSVVGAPHLGQLKRRASFGSGYIHESVFEYFLENLLHFPILLPVQFDSPLEELAHLNLHNGTIWRWNRPIIGFDRDGTPHVRVEHRAMSSGPTIDDSLATMAFVMGASMALAHTPFPYEHQLPYSLLVRNFYNAARKGLTSKQSWVGGNQVDLYKLIKEVLIPLSVEGLKMMNIDAGEIEYYIYEIIHQRVKSMQTGADWQINFINKTNNFKKLTEVYYENQISNKPVHTWT